MSSDERNSSDIRKSNRIRKKKRLGTEFINPNKVHESDFNNSSGSYLSRATAYEEDEGNLTAPTSSTLLKHIADNSFQDVKDEILDDSEAIHPELIRYQSTSPPMEEPHGSYGSSSAWDSNNRNYTVDYLGNRRPIPPRPTSPAQLLFPSRKRSVVPKLLNYGNFRQQHWLNKNMSLKLPVKVLTKQDVIADSLRRNVDRSQVQQNRLVTHKIQPLPIVRSNGWMGMRKMEQKAREDQGNEMKPEHLLNPATSSRSQQLLHPGTSSTVMDFHEKVRMLSMTPPPTLYPNSSWDPTEKDIKEEIDDSEEMQCLPKLEKMLTREEPNHRKPVQQEPPPLQPINTVPVRIVPLFPVKVIPRPVPIPRVMSNAINTGRVSSRPNTFHAERNQLRQYSTAHSRPIQMQNGSRMNGFVSRPVSTEQKPSMRAWNSSTLQYEAREEKVPVEAIVKIEDTTDSAPAAVIATQITEEKPIPMELLGSPLRRSGRPCLGTRPARYDE